MINKKAMQIEFLIYFLILLVILVIFLLYYQKTAELSTANTIADQCRQSITVNAIGHISGLQLYDEVQCPVEYTTIEETESEEIKKEVANSLASCWYKIGEGKYEVFDTNIMKTQYCVICSVLEFESAPDEITGLVSYLDQNTVPVLFTAATPMSYTDYLQGFRSDANLKLLYNQETRDVIYTENNYAAVFLYGKKGYLNHIAAGAVGAGTGFVTGGILIFSGVGVPAGLLVAGTTVAGTAAGFALGSDKTADWESAVALYPYKTEDLKKLDCDILPAEQNIVS